MTTTIDRKNPFLARIKERYPLTKTHSTKETFHVVLDLKNAELSFRPGDSIGIYAHNDPAIVDRFLKILECSGKEEIYDSRSSQSLSLVQFLSEKANLFRCTKNMLQLFEEFSPVKEALADKETLVSFCQTHEPLDLLHRFTKKIDLASFCNSFSPLLPRFYSVASSLKAYPGEVHLTVSLSSYHHGQEKRYGVASYFLCHLADLHKTIVPCYVQSPPHFALPENNNAPLIMIGPGTGVAPFRAFLQERMAEHAKGENWLFFGERNESSDFFYQDEWKDLEKKGKLVLTTAFSRDQSEKVYVQHRLWQERQEIWQWLQEGSFIYVCGEADPMAKEVDAMLHKILEEPLGEEGSKNYIKDLRHKRRYLLDVY